jgi:hypothetical protein
MPMTRDALIVVMLVAAFAALTTAHTTIALGLVRRPPRWRAWVAFFAVPLAPWWGWRERMRARCLLWVVAAIVYGIALRLAWT